MANYIAKIGGLHPNDPLVQYKIDEASELSVDVSIKIRPSMLEENAEKKAAMRKELAETTLPQWYAYAEKLLAENGTGYFVGNSITVADLLWYVHIGWIKSGHLDGLSGAIFDKFPHLTKLEQLVGSNEKIKAWNEAHK